MSKQFKPDHASLRSICSGNGYLADVLNYFIHEGSKELSGNRLSVTISRRHDDILKNIPISEKTLTTHIKELNRLGYVHSKPYSPFYEVDFKTIKKAIQNPPNQIKAKPRGRHAAALNGTYIPNPLEVASQETDAQIVRLQIQRAQLLSELSKIENELAKFASVIYALVDPRDKSTFYVGISLDGEQRFKSHLSCVEDNEAKNARIQELLNLGLTPIYVELEKVLGRSHAFIREQYWIHHFLGLGEILTNIEGVAS